MSENVAIHTRAATLGKDPCKGTLSLSTTHLMWSPLSTEVTTPQPVSVALYQITGVQKAKGKPVLRITTASANRIFMLQTVDERDSLVDVLNPLKDEARRVAGPSATQVSAAQRIIPPVDLQKDVFLKHPDLKEIHTRLVVTGHITESEFWSSKKPILQAVEAGRKLQATGLSTSMLGMIRAPFDSNTGTISFSLTDDVISQIFAENPALYAAYVAHVPHNKSVDQFWEEYFKLVQMRIERRQKRANGTLNATEELLTDFESIVTRFERDEIEKQLPAQRRRLAQSDPTVNIAADLDNDPREGYGVLHQPGRENAHTGKAGGRADDIMRELNSHSAVVLDGRKCGTTGRTPGTGDLLSSKASVQYAENRARSNLADLNSQPAIVYEELKINDPHKYFQRRENAAAKAAGAVPAACTASPVATALAAAEDLAAHFVALRQGTERPRQPMSSHLAFEALEESMQGAQQDGELDELGFRRNPASALVPQLLEGLRKQLLSVNELLRHFWKMMPINSEAKSVKAKRLVTAIDGVYRQTMAMQQAAQGLERGHVTQLLRPAMQAMDVAIARYDDAMLKFAP